MRQMSSLKEKLSKYKPSKSRTVVAGIGVAALAALATAPAAAGSSICSSQLVNNVLDPLLQAVFKLGPLLGTFSGILALVMMSQVTSKEKKKKWKERRNDSFLYGVLGVLVSGYLIETIAYNVLDLREGCLDTSVIGGSGHTVADFAAHVDPATVVALLPF